MYIRWSDPEMKKESAGKKKRREYRRPPKGAKRRKASAAPRAGSRGTSKGTATVGKKKPSRKVKNPDGKQERAPILRRIPRVSARMAILVILMVFFITIAIGPVSRNLEATARLKRKEAELAEQKAATALLEKEVQEARSLEYVEREARRQRMVAPGEVLYLVTTEESDTEVEYRVKNIQSMDEAWERVRRMLKCTHVEEPQ